MAPPEGFLVPLEEHEPIIKKTLVFRSWMVFNCAGDTEAGTDPGWAEVFDFDKYAIKIPARDLHILDPLLSYPSTILGRECAIVVNLEHIKAIITAEEVLLRDPLDDDVVPIVEELQRRLTSPDAAFDGRGEEEDQIGVRNDTHISEENDFPFKFRALEVMLEGICSFLDARSTELETATYPALDELTSKFRALEVMLEGICSFLDARSTELETATYPALDELTSKISSRNLDRVRKLKSAMTRLTNRVQKIRDELEQLLDDDDDMADLYLSRKLYGSSPLTSPSIPNWYLTSPGTATKLSRASRASAVTAHEESDVEQLEMLLEAYFIQIESTINKLNTLREYIDDTEDYINIQLDNHRNQLIQLELFVSSSSVCLSLYSLVAAIFGMNIPYKWREHHDHLFKWVVILTGLACGTLFVSIMAYARQKGLLGS